MQGMLYGKECRMTVWHFAIVICAVLVGEVHALDQAFKGDPAKGRAVYESYCLRCHAKNLDGKGPEAASLSIPPANFHAPHSQAKSEAELRFTIKRGRSMTAMHGWENELRDVQVTDLSAYIRSVIPQQPPE